jgi:hypothetical protein
MKQYLVGIGKRLVPAVLVLIAVVGISGLTMHTPTQNQNFLTFKNIQTNRATLFYAEQRTSRGWFVEMVLPGTGEGKAATENLKSVAATL